MPSNAVVLAFTASGVGATAPPSSPSWAHFLAEAQR